MAEQAKKGGKPAAAPDKDKVSDSDLEKVSGGTGVPPPISEQGRDLASGGDGNVRPVGSG